MRKCRICGEPIPQRRLDALPNTYTCLKCSDEPKVKGFMTWEHKTAPTINIVNDEQLASAHSMSRKGFNAYLGVNSYNNPRLVRSVISAAETSSAADLIRRDRHGVVDLPTNEIVDVVVASVTHPPARCHPDKPRANSSGLCLECSIDWYHKRIPRKP
jgi:hypothetical protein